VENEMTGVFDIITVLILPLVAWLFNYIRSVSKDIWADLKQTKECLTKLKVKVAQDYATHDTVKDVEDKLSQHLIRIEDKLDAIMNNKKA
jgi:hypothetical protein